MSLDDFFDEGRKVQAVAAALKMNHRTVGAIRSSKAMPNAAGLMVLSRLLDCSEKELYARCVKARAAYNAKVKPNGKAKARK